VGAYLGNIGQTMHETIQDEGLPQPLSTTHMTVAVAGGASQGGAHDWA